MRGVCCAVAEEMEENERKKKGGKKCVSLSVPSVDFESAFPFSPAQLTESRVTANGDWPCARFRRQM